MAKLVVNKNETRTITYSDVNLKGLLFCFPMTGAVGSEVMVTDADLQKMFVKVIEERDGQKVNVLPPRISLFDLKNIIFANREYYLEETFKEDIELTNILQFSFGTSKRLKGAHIIYVELEVGNTTVPNVTLYEDFGIGLETHQLVIEELELESNRNDYTLNLGSMVDKVYLKGWNVSAVDTLQIKSDVLNADLDRLQILKMIQDVNIPTPFDATKLVALADASMGGNQVPFNGLNVRIRFVSSGANRKLYIVRRIVTAEITNDFVEKSEEHRIENLRKVKQIDINSACTCSSF